MSDKISIRDTVADLRQRLASLPKIDTRNGGDIMDQHRAHRAAAEELGRYLTETYGARISLRPENNRITMHRITSTSTAGLHGAFTNWIAAAERRRASIGLTDRQLRDQIIGGSA
jgi:hypothetical protein